MQLSDIPMFQKVSLKEKFNFYEYLSVMLDWGVNISEALESVQTKLKNQFFKQKLKELTMFVRSGDPLSKSMKKIPQIFLSGEIAIIESWETTWKLAWSLGQLSENLRKSYDLRSKIKASLTYPTIIFLFLFLAVIIVLTYVIPSISQLFETSEVALPYATIALIATSNFLIHQWYVLLLFVVTIWVLFLWYLSTESGKVSWSHFLLQFPLIGKVRKNYLLAIFATNLWTLISSWIPVVKSLHLAAKSLNDRVYEIYIAEIGQKVSGGQKIVESMWEVDTEHEFFPLDFLQLLSVWEKTANLDSISKKLADQFTREVNYSLTNLTKWIEPVAILIAWIFVLWFAFAIFWAILKVTQTVG